MPTPQSNNSLLKKATIANAKKRKFETPAISPVDATTSDHAFTPIFVLKEQPSILQRKSYGKEARFLTPNPLVVTLNPEFSDFASKIKSATVSVRLVTEDGTDIVGEKASMLHSPNGLERDLTPDFEAAFHLQVIFATKKKIFFFFFRAKFGELN